MISRRPQRAEDVVSGRGDAQRPVASVQGLSIRRGDVSILQSISWTVLKGQNWVILGANGSGKTSLLKALSGYLMPTGGFIEVLGQKYGQADWRDLRLRIGLVSSSIRQMIEGDETALDTVISGKFGMVNLWGRISKADQRQGIRILREVEAEHLHARAWRVLSQGERQRVLIGRALMAAPELLILDEPCAGLDPLAREQFLQFVERLGRFADAPAIVLVTHHVEEIMPVFSHILLLKEGRVLAAGKRERALTSETMSAVFGARMTLRKSKTRYTLKIERENAAGSYEIFPSRVRADLK